MLTAERWSWLFECSPIAGHQALWPTGLDYHQRKGQCTKTLDVALDEQSRYLVALLEEKCPLVCKDPWTLTLKTEERKNGVERRRPQQGQCVRRLKIPFVTSRVNCNIFISSSPMYCTNNYNNHYLMDVTTLCSKDLDHIMSNFSALLSQYLFSSESTRNGVIAGRPVYRERKLRYWTAIAWHTTWGGVTQELSMEDRFQDGSFYSSLKVWRFSPCILFVTSLFYNSR